jgi:hypothetical protein
MAQNFPFDTDFLSGIAEGGEQDTWYSHWAGMTSALTPEMLTPAK